MTVTKAEQKSHSPRRPGAIIGLSWIVLIVLSCAAAPLATTWDPLKQDLANALALPSSTHWLGTDGLGRDVLSRLLYGGRISLSAALTALITAAVLGIPSGLIAGYSRRSWFAGLSARAVDLLQSIPAMIILLAILAFTGRNVYSAMLVFGVLVSPAFYRLAYSGAAAVSAELYVDAARVYGIKPGRILGRHVLPNVLTPLIVQATVVLSIALLVEAGLSYLHLASPPPAPSWGGVIADANAYINVQPWLLVPAGTVLVLTILAFNLIGDDLRSRVPGNTGTAGERLLSERQPLPPLSTPSTQHEPTPPSILSVRALNISAAGANGHDTQLLRDVSFEVAAGEVVALVGESGSGKTMTAMSIIGLLPPGVAATSGIIDYEGTDLLRLPAGKMPSIRGARIAYIGQEPMVALDPSYRVETQIDESLKLHRSLSPRQRKAEVRSLLQQVRINDVERVARAFPHELSGGMAQRVCIAMALAAEPDLLIADEPTTALDVTVQAEVLDVLRSLCRSRNMAMILVTHDFGVVADVATRAVVMLNGTIVEDASAQELFDSPAHEYTQRLLASNPATQGDEHAVWYNEQILEQTK